MGKAEWGGNPVCWWLGLYFCFVCCLDEASCIGCYCWLGDAGSYIQVVSFVWVLTIWYSLGLVLWLSRALESVLPLQGLRAWSCWCFTIRKTGCSHAADPRVDCSDFCENNLAKHVSLHPSAQELLLDLSSLHRRKEEQENPSTFHHWGPRKGLTAPVDSCSFCQWESPKSSLTWTAAKEILKALATVSLEPILL